MLVLRDAIAQNYDTDEEKNKLISAYGKYLMNLNEWKELFSLNNLEIVDIDINSWSEPSVFWNVRTDRNVEKFDDIYTTSEKMIISKRIMKKFGRNGLSVSSENEKTFIEAIKNNKIIYGLFVLRKK